MRDHSLPTERLPATGLTITMVYDSGIFFAPHKTFLIQGLVASSKYSYLYLGCTLTDPTASVNTSNNKAHWASAMRKWNPSQLSSKEEGAS
jgi:hypothetical protein